MTIWSSKRRILVIGPSGAGKSYVARHLGALLGLPVVHLDRHYWQAGWVPSEEADWKATVEGLLGQPGWVMDGNYAGTLARRLAACDAVLLLDLPRLRCLAGVLRRRWAHRRRSRPDVAEGCPERLSVEFLCWIWSYPRRFRPGVLQLLARREGATLVTTLRSRAEIDAFLAALGPSRVPRLCPAPAPCGTLDASGGRRRRRPVVTR